MISAHSNLFGLSLARQRTRRWLVAAILGGLIPLLCVVFQNYVVNAHGSNGFALNLCFQSIFWIAALLGGVRAGGWVKPFRAQPQARDIVQPLFGKPQPTRGELIAQDLALDERESNQRDHIHFVAYTIAQTMVLLLFFLYGLLGLWKQELLRQTGPLFFFLLTVTLWSLPQALILWTEPDMEPKP
jgi:hypothetical protein